jgi:PAS domain S-box-containing protein
MKDSRGLCETGAREARPPAHARERQRRSLFRFPAWYRPTLILAALAGYAVAFDAIHRAIGPAVGAFSFMPVLVAGALSGSAAGALAGIILIPVNAVLFRAAGSVLGSWSSHIVPGLAGVFAGAIAGRLRDLRVALEEALRQKTEAARALEDREAQFSLAQEASHAGNWVLEIGTGSIYWSAEIYRILGIDPRTTPTRELFLEHVHPEDRAAVDDSVQRSIKERSALAIEHRIVRADGQIRFVHASGKILTDESGRPSKLVGTTQDISERKEHAAALRAANAELATAHTAAMRSRDNFRKILESIPDVVVMTRMDGSIAFVNGAGQSMFGIEPGSPIKTRSVLERVLPEDRPVLMRRRELAAAGRDPGEATVRVLTTQGVRECEISGLRVDFDGEPAIVTMVRDVSERREMGRKLALAERMASLGTLAGGVAHEINNPLSYILGNLRFISGELAGLEVKGPPDRLAEVRQVAGEALEGAERVRRIVQDLHAFSRPSETLGPVDVHRVLDLAINMAWSQIRYRASLVKDYADILPVQGDESRLNQLTLNLLINAAQAIQEGRPADNEIRVVTRMMGADHVAIEIQDTGCGIPPEVRSRMFEPFFTTKPVGAGTGLGLSICHGIVGSLGGEISVESEVGTGSTFRVMLPAAPQVGVPAPPLRDPHASDTQGMRVELSCEAR